MARHWSPTFLALLLSLSPVAFCQTFRRLGTCPTLGCVFPPDQTEFLAGQLFDIRLETHAPTSGREVTNGIPDENFTFCIQKGEGRCEDATKFFKIQDAPVEKWNFTYYEDLFARDAEEETLVNVAAKAYRGVIIAPSSYNNGAKTVANWEVRKPKKRVAKNVLFFIGDGMTQPMITAARLIGHKSINGKYQTLMQMDQMEANGLQMTHSVDSFITDSANSATALYTGKKTTVDALNVFVDSSPDQLDDPKFETIAELAVGIVSTAYITDATPGGVCAHTRSRDRSKEIVQEFLYNTSVVTPNLQWPTGCKQPDVIFGGGAETFIPGSGSPNGTDFYKAFQNSGYQVAYNNTQLKTLNNNERALGIFSVSNLAKWLDRNILPENLKKLKNSPTGDGTAAIDQPGLKDMTLKAIDILQARTKKKEGWFLMAEAANIDKMMHVLDYDRALGDLLELDDTFALLWLITSTDTMPDLKKIGQLEDTLIVVTADHGHGFDVFGGADTAYLKAQTDDRKKRGAVGIYERSGLSEYQVAPGSTADNNTILFGAQGAHFPLQWTPRYTFAAGFGGMPDVHESYSLNLEGPRVPTAPGEDGTYYANPADRPEGFSIHGTLPPTSSNGVHSLQDVPVYASGPGAASFRGVYNSIDIFFKIADALGLGGK
ncbi:alkaline phosphatase [Coprinopsis sp. MPI-PUGE-AT-0042]|nr:alkaline phosphatase [Coprinopsis sp. MPI-PUGE-AT-0042]